MTTRRASCSCGQLHVTCEGEPVRVSVCHCLACQKRTGSTFAVQARFGREHVAVEGRDSKWSRVGDDGGRIVFHFCPDCGATVFYECDDFMPGFVAIPVGAFADPKFPAPTVSVYGARRHAWTAMPGLHAEELD